MDDDSSFKDRVQKIFGSLSSSSSPWSLTDDEIEKREWRRDKDDDEVTLPSLANSKKKRRNDFDQDLEDEDEDEDVSLEKDHEEDDWGIRSSIGLDTTLDQEAEEDEYDKLAEGREDSGDRLYMSSVADHGPYLNSHNVLPYSVLDAPKDPRANHFAARDRLKEDEAESEKFGNLQSRRADVSAKIKPILKMRDNSAASKGQRRVRFDPYCKEKPEDGGTTKDFSSGAPVLETTVSDYNAWAKSSPQVPDYVLNPSKYKRYSFDSISEVDNELNTGAGTEVPKTEPDSQLEGGPLHPPKSITFIPRKKQAGPTPMDSSSEGEHKQENDIGQSGSVLAVASRDNEGSEDMDVVDELVTMIPENQKPIRRYRFRAKQDDSVI